MWSDFYVCKSVSEGESKSLLRNRPPSRRSKHVQRGVGGSAPLVMTYQSDFYSWLSAVQFSFKVDELRATIITLKWWTSQEFLIICECSDLVWGKLGFLFLFLYLFVFCFVFCKLQDLGQAVKVCLVSSLPKYLPVCLSSYLSVSYLPV